MQGSCSWRRSSYTCQLWSCNRGPSRSWRTSGWRPNNSSSTSRSDAIWKQHQWRDCNALHYRVLFRDCWTYCANPQAGMRGVFWSRPHRQGWSEGTSQEVGLDQRRVLGDGKRLVIKSSLPLCPFRHTLWNLLKSKGDTPAWWRAQAPEKRRRTRRPQWIVFLRPAKSWPRQQCLRHLLQTDPTLHCHRCRLEPGTTQKVNLLVDEILEDSVGCNPTLLCYAECMHVRRWEAQIHDDRQLHSRDNCTSGGMQQSTCSFALGSDPSWVRNRGWSRVSATALQRMGQNCGRSHLQEGQLWNLHLPKESRQEGQSRCQQADP